MASVEMGSTDGDDPFIETDLQSQLDAVFASNASQAPGRALTGYKSVDIRLEAKSEHLTARLGYQGVVDNNAAVGIAGALDPQGQFRSDRASTDISYRRDDPASDWVWTTRFNALYVSQISTQDARLFPPGAFGGAFPDGMTRESR